MPGQRDDYVARTVDVSAQYSDDHDWCRITGFLPDPDDFPEIVAVYGFLRGGGGISEPSRWDTAYDPEDVVGDAALAHTLLGLGCAYFEIEYPNLPRSAIGSRHQPFKRLPHNWRTARKAVQYIQTHALDGRITGTRSWTLPTDYRRYVLDGISEGALFAAQIALAPIGETGSDNFTRRSVGHPYAYTGSGRIIGAVLNDLPADFRIYDRSISGDGIQHFGVSERFYTDPFNNEAIMDINRWDGVSAEDKRDIGVLRTIQLDAVENRSVGLFVNGSAAADEASYRNSGLTFTITGTVNGLLDGATTVFVAADPSKVATVKLIAPDAAGGPVVYAEAGVGTNLADWTGDIEFSTGATVDGDDYGVTGADTQKTFLTRDQSVNAFLASNFAPAPEITRPHPVDASALVRYYRLRNKGRSARDVYRLGSAYTAQISGDTPHLGYDTTLDGNEIPRFMVGLGIPLELE